MSSKVSLMQVLLCVDAGVCVIFASGFPITHVASVPGVCMASRKLDSGVGQEVEQSIWCEVYAVEFAFMGGSG